ncbi:MAG: hypothetical protein ABSC94_32335 [Polyangiaceae bacterium]
MLGLEVEKDVILVGERDEEVSVATRLVCSVWQGMGWIATPVASVDKQNAVAMASLRAASTSRVIKILGRQMQPRVAPTCSEYRHIVPRSRAKPSCAHCCS